MYRNNSYPRFTTLLRTRPQAIAFIKGNHIYPSICGEVRFHQTQYGALIVAEISGLPAPTDTCMLMTDDKYSQMRSPKYDSGIFGFHIHSGNSCTRNSDDDFANTLGHYDPYRCPHPYHAGDMPPLFSAGGYAFLSFLSNRITVNDIIGKTVVIHSSLDDFSTQSSGNTGTKIACGVIEG